MASKTRAPARARRPVRKGRRKIDSNRARKFGRKIPRQEIPTPRGRPYVPVHRTYTPELLASGQRRYEDTDEPVAAIAADFRIHAGSLRRLARELGWVRFDRGPRELPVASRLLAKAEALEQALERGTLPAGESGDEETPSLALPLAGGGDTTAVGDAGAPSAEDIEAARAARAARMIDDLERETDEEITAVRALREALKGVPRRPREGEATARTLSTLTETVQKIHRMRCALTQSRPYDNDDMPADIDEFREALARKIEAFMESRPDEDFIEDVDAEPARPV